MNIFNYNNTIGTFNISSGGYINAVAVFEDHVNNTYFDATSGTITITKISSNNVQGTFNFDAGNISVTEGVFNVPLN